MGKQLPSAAFIVTKRTRKFIVFFRDGVVQLFEAWMPSFAPRNGFADFCRNKSQACGRQLQIALTQVVVLTVSSFSPQGNEEVIFI